MQEKFAIRKVNGWARRVESGDYNRICWSCGDKLVVLSAHATDSFSVKLFNPLGDNAFVRTSSHIEAHNLAYGFMLRN